MLFHEEKKKERERECIEEWMDVCVYICVCVYRTRWGENLMLVGAGAALGEWETRSGLWMSCRPCPHEEEELIWEASTVVSFEGNAESDDSEEAAAVRGSAAIELEYQYVVVDDKVRVLRREVRTRRLVLTLSDLMERVQVASDAGPASPGSDDVWKVIEVDACDWWDAAADAELLFGDGAHCFKRALLGDTQRVSRSETTKSVSTRPIDVRGGDTNEDELISSPEAAAGNGMHDANGIGVQSAQPMPMSPEQPCGSITDDDCVLVRFSVRRSEEEMRPHACIVLTNCSFTPLDVNAEEDSSHSNGIIRMERERRSGRDRCVWEKEVFIARRDFPIAYSYAVASEDPSPAHGTRAGGELHIEQTSTVMRGNIDMSRLHEPPALIVFNNGCFVSSSNLASWRGFGVAAPVFSLRTNASLGCGDFRDLRSLVEFTHKCRGNVVQILPVNDTCVHGTWRDSYPYSSRSVYALHPLYLVPDELLVGMSLPQEIRDEADELRRSLNSLDDMDYEKTLAAKLQLAQQAFAYVGGEDALSTMLGFDTFVRENEDWLQPYAAFCFLQSVTGTSEHWTWGEWAKPSTQLIERLTSRKSLHFRSIALTYFVQFALHRQLLETSRFAESLGIALKGDLPIGVDNCSVDTWLRPDQFRIGTSTGAPPDFFDGGGGGQNWGFPTYAWENMANDGYAWWKSRIRRMEIYFHAYRIDHILGFFRIWELPAHTMNGILGRFRPSTPFTDAELRARGVYDIDRVVQPYIRWHHLNDAFDDRAPEIVGRYLVEHPEGVFRFRNDFSTEKALRAAVPASDQDVFDKLLTMMQSVCLIRHAEDAQRFFPRILMEDTTSFRELDAVAQDALISMSNDFFYHRHHLLWREHALKVLPVLQQASGMLVCGEDLGMVPSCVDPVLEELRILGLRVQRMPESGNLDNPADYPYSSVCTTSSHDIANLRAWLEEPETRGLLEEEFPDMELTQEALVKQHLESPSCLCILPIQDVIQMLPRYRTRDTQDEVINNPANSKHYWKYRMENDIASTLCKDDELIGLVAGMVTAAGRGADIALASSS